MTCVNCKFQWCWLCEDEYKYGHYNSGKCQDQQFSKADYPKEINNETNYNNNRIINQNQERNLNNRNNRNTRFCKFGLHRIFRCVCKDITAPFPFPFDSVILSYRLIFSCYLFGVLFLFMYIADYNAMQNGFSDKRYYYVIAFLIGLSFWLIFQISFSCLVTPLMLICLIYYKSLAIIIVFFGEGED